MTPHSAYSDMKLAWQSETVLDLLRHRYPVPVHMQLHLTARCNARCPHCINGGLISRLRRTPTDELPTPLAQQIIRDFADLGGRAIEFTGGGEPTLHPAFGSLLKIVHPNVDVALISNGLWPRDVCPARVASRCRWIRISLDACDRQAYRYRKGMDGFDRVCDTIRQLVRWGGRVNISYLVMEDSTPGEIRAAIALSRELGAQSIRFAPVYAEDTPSSVPLDVQWTVGHEALESRDVVNMIPQRLTDTAARFAHPSGECGYQWTSFVVAADGFLYPCCFMAYDVRRRRLDLREWPLTAWWGTEGHFAALEDWDCARDCSGSACWHRGKNRVFQQIVRDEPRDVNFI